MNNNPVRKFYHSLYFYVLIAIIAGIILGITSPSTGENMKILSDLFIRMLKLIIAPLIFLTVTTGIAGLQNMKKVGKIGLKAILYFEVISTLALIIGLIVIKIIRPGEGMNINPSLLDTSQLANYIPDKNSNGSFDLIFKIIPSNIIDPFIKGEILQVLFLAILCGFAISAMKETGKKITHGLELVSKLFFRLVGFMMYAAPLGAFGAMSFTISKFGLASLFSLGKLLLCIYITCFAFVFIVLGLVAKASGFSLKKFIWYIRQEILVVLGTSSSESVLPNIMRKMEKLGCSKAVTGLVIPTGYSFNLDGTSIYLTMSTVFIAQATNTHLSMYDLVLLLGVLMLTSKGAAAVTGGGLITLGATLGSIDIIPLAGITLLIGIDRFMSEARAITNLIGNGVATLVISNWEKETDKEKLNEELGK